MPENEYKLCLQCGHIFYEALVCPKCGHEINSSQYLKLKDYSNQAAYYGYYYRTLYEKQYKENREIKVKFSLIQPENYIELLAIAALSGIVGSLAYDLTKYIASQVWDLIKRNNQEDKYRRVLEVVNDERNLRLFIKYVQAYYCDMTKVKGEIKEAIIEELMADEIAKIIKGEIGNVGSEEILDAAKKVDKRRREKPTIGTLSGLLKDLKKEMKNNSRRNVNKKTGKECA